MNFTKGNYQPNAYTESENLTLELDYLMSNDLEDEAINAISLKERLGTKFHTSVIQYTESIQNSLRDFDPSNRWENILEPALRESFSFLESISDNSREYALDAEIQYRDSASRQGVGEVVLRMDENDLITILDQATLEDYRNTLKQLEERRSLDEI